MLKSLLFRLGFAVVALSLFAANAQESGAVTTTFSIDPRGTVQSTTPGGPAHHPSQILVRFRNGLPHDFEPGSGPPNGFRNIPNLFVVPIPPGLSVAAAVARYKAKPGVLYAEPDFVVHAINTTPSDPLWNKQWDMVKI